MNDTVAAISAAMHADAESLRTISLNIANAQNPAYRREIALQRASFADAADGAGVPQAQSAIDRRAGTLRSTGESLNVAIEGTGFFVIGTSHGEVLTRRGDFHLDGNGQIVTHQGDPVLGTRGPIHVDGATPAISADGTVRVGDTVIDRLRLVEVPAETPLQPAGESTYVTGNGEQPLESSASLVRQGFLETSNVESVNEMVQMLEVMRRFEAAQRFERGYDGMVDDAIKTLGRV